MLLGYAEYWPVGVLMCSIVGQESAAVAPFLADANVPAICCKCRIGIYADVVELSSFCALSSRFGRNGSLPVSFSLAKRLAMDQMLECVTQILLLSGPGLHFLRILQRRFGRESEASAHGWFRSLRGCSEFKWTSALEQADPTSGLIEADVRDDLVIGSIPTW
ncbi:hypothetical protein Nepgr_033549 [Nepenthes gracilis]|uniref:Uncharacterized protein n=1 Tax=Nepenthes gracilis TaxID=150966 RepID=A0AAD3TLD9_NEPGR|nr:hypothetical protein Nepgr_033549 [Nepenthes gracilis]